MNRRRFLSLLGTVAAVPVALAGVPVARPALGDTAAPPPSLHLGTLAVMACAEASAAEMALAAQPYRPGTRRQRALALIDCTIAGAHLVAAAAKGDQRGMEQAREALQAVDTSWVFPMPGPSLDETRGTVVRPRVMLRQRAPWRTP